MLLNQIHPSSFTRPRGQAGFSLIEVMVTMLILTFGLLGVASVLVKGISNVSASESMAKASQLGAGMADRIRANPSAAIAENSEYITEFSETSTNNSSTIAQRDKKVWLDALAAQLPQGTGQITRSVNSSRGLDIAVRWSNCLGTLSEAAQTLCKNNSANTLKVLTFELRM